MRAKSAAVVGFTTALAAVGSIYIIAGSAQQPGRSSNPPALTTNWVGYVVAGRHDPSDRISRSPSPAIIPQFEIGLRSDGVVIWRDATNAK